MEKRMKNIKIREIMTDHPFMISPNATLREAAELMKKANCGFLPVGRKSKVVGIITDRDIVIRSVAEAKNPLAEKVCDHMTDAVYSCNEDDFLEDAAEKMQAHKVTRLVVRNEHGRVVGVLSLGALLRRDVGAREAAKTINHVLGVPTSDERLST
jgi:CBS domain-containing protein